MQHVQDKTLDAIQIHHSPFHPIANILVIKMPEALTVIQTASSHQNDNIVLLIENLSYINSIIIFYSCHQPVQQD